MAVGPLLDPMEGGLSERDMVRIEKFARTPAFRRTPEMLVPDEDEE